MPRAMRKELLVKVFTVPCLACSDERRPFRPKRYLRIQKGPSSHRSLLTGLFSSSNSVRLLQILAGMIELANVPVMLLSCTMKWK